MAVLDDILAVNAKVAGRLPAMERDFKASRRLCLVTCIDPRLTRFFSQALGIERGEATIVRLPGPVVAGGTDLVRAVATAIFANDCDEVLVLAHTDCAMVRCDSGSLASVMNRKGVGGALPTDPRTFFGLAASPRQIASDTASAIRGSPVIPAEVLVHAAVIDIKTGALEIVSRGENAQAQPGTASAFSGAGRLPSLSGPSAFDKLTSMPGLDLPTPSSLPSLGGPALSSLPSLSGPGFTASGGLPSGLGISEGSARSAVAAPIAAFGRMEATAPSIPNAHENVTSFHMPTFDQALKSTIDLTPTAMFGTSTAVEPVGALEHSTPLDNVGTAFVIPAAVEPAAPRPPPTPKQSRPAQQPPPRPPPRKAAPVQQQSQRAPAAPRLSVSPQMLANLEKVGAFYRAEMKPETRAQAASALDTAYRAASPNAELIRVVFKPILESGPKRYKVIDELLAIKEGAAAMERNDCYSALRQLLD
ncbi:MAG TPA: carbonic anhydrase [Myxococcales bacterium]|jgi:carbonic anhydrase